MTLVELVNLLDSTGYPVSFSHFKERPSIPFITYMIPSEEGFNADNTNYHTLTDVDIELYTDKKDLVAEQAIESLLKQHELPFTSYQIYIDSEQVFQKTYEVRLI